jgi:hypothetical protein
MSFAGKAAAAEDRRIAELAARAVRAARQGAAAEGVEQERLLVVRVELAAKVK